jgi:hypothetical protein
VTLAKHVWSMIRNSLGTYWAGMSVESWEPSPKSRAEKENTVSWGNINVENYLNSDDSRGRI